jgi:hypothetical protein
MTRPLIQIGDEVREMTEQEFADHQKFVTEQAKTLETMTAARASAIAKLAELGLTDDEISALVS